MAEPGRGQGDDGQARQWVMLREARQGEEVTTMSVFTAASSAPQTTDHRETVGGAGWTGREKGRA